MKYVLTFILSIIAISGYAITPTTFGCDNFPITRFSVDSFGTYQQRQKNPNVKDITSLVFTQKTHTSAGHYVLGYAVMPNGSAQHFTATCVVRSYNGIHELYLTFSGNEMDQCSGIFNFALTSPQGVGLGSAIYLGGPSLLTGDDKYQSCANKAYGSAEPANNFIPSTIGKFKAGAPRRF